MKKKSFFYAVAAGAMMLTACSSHDEPGSMNGSDNEGVQEFILQVSNTGSGLQSRAGRPLLSDEAKQTINVVKVFFCDANDNNKLLKVKVFSDWMGEDSKAYETGGHGREAKITFEGADKLSDGKVNIYAIGYHSDSDYNLGQIATLSEPTDENPLPDTNFDENIVLDYKEGKSIPEEIFAGSLTLDVIKAKGFKKSIVLNRQVAGAYFYVTNIPQIEGKTLDANCELRLVASDANNQLVLGNYANYDLAHNGEDNGTNVNYVVNAKKKNGAAAEANAKVICSAKLGDWYRAFTFTDKGILDRENWITTAEANSDASIKDRKGGHYTKGSIFSGNFVMPFKAVKIENTPAQTLKLMLVNGSGEEYVSWNVNLPEDEVSPALTYFGSKDGDFTWIPLDDYKETIRSYSILRNHLYSVGKKITDGKGGTDPDPDPENPDQPEDLDKGQELILHVNDNWEVIHRMELE